MLTHLRSVGNRCLGWMDYFCCHGLDPLGNSLSSTRLIPEVYHVALQELFGMKVLGIIIRIVIWVFCGPKNMEGDFFSLGSQF